MDIATVPKGAIVLALLLLTSCVPPQSTQPMIAPQEPTALIEAAIASESTLTVVPDPTATGMGMSESQQQVNETVQQFVALNKADALASDDAKALFAGELSNWDAATIGEIVSEPVTIVLVDPTHAVTRIQIMDGYLFDAYLYLSLDSTWRISALRAMAVPGYLRQAYTEFQNQTDLTPEETQFREEIAPLFLTDQEWREWFGQNQHSLNAICVEAMEKLSNEVNSINPANIDRYPDIEEAFGMLGIQSVEKTPNGDLLITTAGIIDTSVGFVCSPQSTPPPMSPSGFIWVEEIEAGWYLFRTT